MRGPTNAQVLRMPLFQLPQLLNQIVNAQVALGRLQELLAADSQDPIPQLPPAKEGVIHTLKVDTGHQLIAHFHRNRKLAATKTTEGDKIDLWQI